MKSRKTEVPTSKNSELRAAKPQSVDTARVRPNGDEVFLADQADLNIEELEPVIAPGINLANHNETFVTADTELQAEELEPVIAPLGGANHNETFIAADSELQADELETVIAPQGLWGW